MKRKLLVIDTETGGLDAAQHSLLSLGAVVYHDGAIEDEFYTLIREPEFLATEGALKVNNLTRELIEADGVSPLTAVGMLVTMLQKHDMRTGVTIVAHNAPFDIPFLKRLWRLAGKTEREYGKQFSYRSLCTQVGALLLEQAGCVELPAGSASLDNLVKLWGIKLDRSEGHNALHDAKAAAEVLRREIELLGKGR